MGTTIIQPCKKANDATFYCDRIKTEIIGQEPCNECPHRAKDNAVSIIKMIEIGSFPDGITDPKMMAELKETLQELVDIRNAARQTVVAKSERWKNNNLSHLRDLIEAHDRPKS